MLLPLLCLLSCAASIPVPQQLTEEEFKKGRSLALPSDDVTVFISPSYSQVRRQGGRSFKDNIPINYPTLTVKSPNQLAGDTSKQEVTNPNGPVFNVKDFTDLNEINDIKSKIDLANEQEEERILEAEEAVAGLIKDAAEQFTEEAVDASVDSDAVDAAALDMAVEEAAIDAAAMDMAVEEAAIDAAAMDMAAEEAAIDAAAMDMAAEEAAIDAAAMDMAAEEAAIDAAAMDMAVEEAAIDAAAMDMAVEEAAIDAAALDMAVEEAAIDAAALEMAVNELAEESAEAEAVLQGAGETLAALEMIEKMAGLDSDAIDEMVVEKLVEEMVTGSVLGDQSGSVDPSLTSLDGLLSLSGGMDDLATIGGVDLKSVDIGSIMEVSPEMKLAIENEISQQLSQDLSEELTSQLSETLDPATAAAVGEELVTELDQILLEESAQELVEEIGEEMEHGMTIEEVTTNNIILDTAAEETTEAWQEEEEEETEGEDYYIESESLDEENEIEDDPETVTDADPNEYEAESVFEEAMEELLAEDQDSTTETPDVDFGLIQEVTATDAITEVQS